MRDIVINLLANLVWMLIGIGVLKTVTFFHRTLPLRKLWSLSKPENVVICVPCSTETQTSQYIRPATGIGQVKAIAFLVTSLYRTYDKVNLKDIYFSTDSIEKEIENDLIILGGPKNNQFSRRFLELIEDKQPATMKTRGNVDTILWRNKKKQSWVEKNAEEFLGISKEGVIEKDFGLIIRTANPFSSKTSTVLFLAGSHTYGTLAASKYFTDGLLSEIRKLRNNKANISIVISAKISQGYPISIKIEKFYEW